MSDGAGQVDGRRLCGQTGGASHIISSVSRLPNGSHGGGAPDDPPQCGGIEEGDYTGKKRVCQCPDGALSRKLRELSELVRGERKARNRMWILARDPATGVREKFGGLPVTNAVGWQGGVRLCS